MKNISDQELRELRFTPSPSEGFAERIISAAAALEQKQTASLLQWVMNLFAEFMLPKPAYSFAAVLLIGLFFGFSIGNLNTDNSVENSEISIYDDGVNL